MTTEDLSAYFQKLEDAIDNALKIYNDAQWILKEKNSDIAYYQRIEESCFKCDTYIPCTIDELEKRFRINPRISKCTPKNEREGYIERKTIYQIDENTSFLYFAIESNFIFISPRDFLIIQGISRRDGKVLLVGTSIVDEVIQPDVKGIIRGNIHFQAYIGEEDKERTGFIKLTFLIKVDLCGLIPPIAYGTIVHQRMSNILKYKKQLSK